MIGFQIAYYHSNTLKLNYIRKKRKKPCFSFQNILNGDLALSNKIALAVQSGIKSSVH